MMRVLMVLFKDIHYDARVHREAIALAEAGWYVDIACLHTTSQPAPEIHERVRLLRYPIQTKRIKRYVEQKADQRVKRGVYRVVRNPMVKVAKDAVAKRDFAMKVWDLCQGANYSAVHCHGAETLSIGAYLKQKHGLTLVYDPHHVYEDSNGKKRWERTASQRAETVWMDEVDHMIAINELIEAEFQHRYPNLSITVLRNIPQTLDQLPREKNYFHRRYDLKAEDQVILYQGGFTQNRGLEELIRALVHLPERHKLVLLGFGEWKERLEQLVKEKGLTDRVFFHPPLLPCKLLQVTSHADLGAVLYQSTCPKNRLVTPNKLFEYIQAGIPVISSDRPGKAIVVGTYQAGRLVDPHNVQEIADAIREILSDPDPWLIGTHKARKQLRWEKEQERLVELYRQIILARRNQRDESEQEPEQEDLFSIQPHLRQL